MVHVERLASVPTSSSYSMPLVGGGSAGDPAAAEEVRREVAEIQGLCAQMCLGFHLAARCHATQTQSTQRKSSTATIQRSNPKGKLKGPKLDGNGGYPPFRFGKGGGGGGGGGGGTNYSGGFLLFACVLLLDYRKEFEKNLLLRRHRTGDEACIGLA